MSVLYDDWSVIVETRDLDITLIVVGGQYTESADLSVAKARAIAAALIKAAEEREAFAAGITK